MESGGSAFFAWLAEKNDQEEGVTDLVNFLEIPRCYSIVLCTVAEHS